MKIYIILLFIVTQAPLFGQNFNKLYDFGSYSTDAIFGLYPDENFVLVVSIHLNADTGGYIVGFIDRNNGELLRSIPYYKMDSVAQSYRILKMGSNEWMICGLIIPYTGGIGSYFTHFVDSMGNTLNYEVYPSIPHSLQLWDACKTRNGVLLSGNRYFPSPGLEKSYLMFVDFYGEPLWSAFPLDSIWTSSTRCSCLKDTIVLVMTELISGENAKYTHLLKLDTSGIILDRARITTVDDMVVADMRLSADSTEILLSGYQAITGGSKPAIVVLDRALNVKRSRIYHIGDGGLGRAAVFTSDDKIVLTGHGRDLALFDNFDNAFVLRVNRSTLLAEALYWYTPSGIQADGNVQIMTRAELDGGQMFVSGHGGIVDTSFSQDAWLLALNEDGTCDSASCYPWLVSGIEGVPFEDLDAFKAWYSGGNISITLTETSLLNDGARLVILNAEGRILVETPFKEMQNSFPTTGWSSGAYFVIYQSSAGRIIRKVWVS